jgi:threonine dehydrogenase-like Zn-dependent dehydrogenase
MRALVAGGPGEVGVEEIAAPAAGPGELLVRPLLVGVCGTDLDIIRGDIDPAFVRRPLVLGHEWVGVLESTTGTVDFPPIGARVVVEGIVHCGHCAECVTGDTNRCETYDEIGFTRAGAAADLVSVPARLVHGLADGVSLESAALVEPAAVVLRALLRAIPSPGQRVLVIGDGTVGLLAVRLVQLWAPASVTLFGLREDQRELAVVAGATEFRTDGGTEPGSYDIVLEAAGAVASVRAALASPRRGGTVLLLGYPGVEATVPRPVDDLVNGDVRVIGSFSYTSSVWRQVVDLLNSGQLDLSFLVTHRYRLEQWDAALEPCGAASASASAPRCCSTCAPTSSQRRPDGRLFRLSRARASTAAEVVEECDRSRTCRATSSVRSITSTEKRFANSACKAEAVTGSGTTMTTRFAVAIGTALPSRAAGGRPMGRAASEDGATSDEMAMSECSHRCLRRPRLAGNGRSLPVAATFDTCYTGPTLRPYEEARSRSSGPLVALRTIDYQRYQREPSPERRPKPTIQASAKTTATIQSA